jgi:hypothetical protein
VRACHPSGIIAYSAARGEDAILADLYGVTITDAIMGPMRTKPMTKRPGNHLSAVGDDRATAALPFRPVQVETILRFEPRAEWFRRSPYGIHGVAHETRVLIWTQVLAGMVPQEGLSVDAEALGWAAAIHDSQRADEGTDPQHGVRAAEWIEQNRQYLSPSAHLERVAYICRWHVHPDHEAPDMTPELMVFKEADALDRWRIGDLNPDFLRTKAAHKLLEVSCLLWRGTQQPHSNKSAFLYIVSVAKQMRILSGMF